MTAVARRPIRIAVVGAVLGWSAALAAAAPAPALEYVSAQVVGGQNAQGGTDVMCPNGKHVTGGGVFSNTGYDQTTVNDSVPIDGADADSKPDDGWRGTFDNPTTGFPNLTVLAICGKAMPKYRSVPFETHGSVTTAPCSKRTKPIGGGVSTEGTLAQASRVISSYPGDGLDANSRPEYWIGYGEADGLAHIPARVHVICVKKEKKLRYRFADIPVGPTSQAGATVDCRDDERLAGIGAATLSGVMTINTMYGLDGPDADADPDDGAQARVDNMLTFERSGRVYAMCAR
jgi:hypothetical protein